MVCSASVVVGEDVGVGVADATSDGAAGCDCVGVGVGRSEGVVICSGAQPMNVTSDDKVSATDTKVRDGANTIKGS